ncbi:hypothetical protein E2C01_060342 [Portunus trituberculatus]|uniref:Uncharacterized protein n=1 Tax=Portunus trituberculatus TaxID=210409 RepID=A0A5B7H8G0_PORTR|nr:hypothetical protein [Portunus trituberculatus]
MEADAVAVTERLQDEMGDAMAERLQDGERKVAAICRMTLLQLYLGSSSTPPVGSSKMLLQLH